MPGNRRLVTAVLRGRESVTVLTAEHSASGVVVRALANRPARHGDADAERDALRGTLADARQQAGGTGVTVTALKARLAVMREAQFPLLSPQELVSALQNEARRHIPLDLRESSFDYQVLGRNEQEGTTHVLMVAAPRRNLVNAVEPLSRVGAEPWIIDVEPLAAVNALLHFEPLEDGQALGFIEITPGGLTVTLLSSDGHFFTRTVGSYGAEGGENSTEVTLLTDTFSSQDAALPDADRLTMDLRRTLSFFQQSLGRKPRLRLRVVGPDPLRTDFISRLRTTLQIEDVGPVPLDRVPLAKGASVPASLRTGETADLLVAFGLALRHTTPFPAQRPRLTINVYPDRARRVRRERSRMIGVAAACVVLAINAFALLFLLLATRNLARYVQTDVAEVERIRAEAVHIRSTTGNAFDAFEALDKHRVRRTVWSPALVAAAARLPWSLELSSVALGGTAQGDSLSTTLTIRGVVVRSSNADPFGPVTDYVQNLRVSPNMQQLFPYVDIVNTWEVSTGGSPTRYFEIRCTRREQIQ